MICPNCGQSDRSKFRLTSMESVVDLINGYICLVCGVWFLDLGYDPNPNDSWKDDIALIELLAEDK